jgi:hypothetical protein
MSRTLLISRLESLTYACVLIALGGAGFGCVWSGLQDTATSKPAPRPAWLRQVDADWTQWDLKIEENHALSNPVRVRACSIPATTECSTASRVIGRADVSAAADRPQISAGESVEVRIFLDHALDALQSYQLDTAVSGGRRGHLELERVHIESRPDHVFGDQAATINAREFSARAGASTSGPVATAAGAYLATFTFRSTRDARGTFSIMPLTRGGTQLMRTGNRMIEVDAATPARIHVEAYDSLGRSASAQFASLTP